MHIRMQLKRILVENYKSVRRVDFEPGDFAVFVGLDTNNRGQITAFANIKINCALTLLILGVAG